MRGLQLIPYDTNINFVGIRHYIYILSLAIIVLCGWSLAFKGLNYGIDFKGGFLLEIRTKEKANIAQMRTQLETLKLGEVKLQEFGSDRDIMIRIEKQPGGEQAQAVALQKIKDLLGKDVEYRRVETVGGKVSSDLVENGLWALGFALIGMLLYIWVRFEWHFGLCGILALAHDVIVVLGFYSLTGHEFKETAFIAILTTVGYSINDSVVIYDRIRDNLRKYKKMPIEQLINLSTNETLSRTIITVATTVISLLALYLFGGSEISSFSLPILIGIIFGSYSSIFVSANLLLFFDIRKTTAEKGEVV